MALPAEKPAIRPQLLLVDDDPRIMSITMKNLQISGFDVTKAKTNAMALAELRAKQYDLILIDPNLNKASGFELMEMINVDKDLGGIPMIMLTGLKAKQSVQRCLHLGAAAYVLKPFKPDVLAQHIQRTLKLNDKNEVNQTAAQERKEKSNSRAQSIQKIMLKLQEGKIEFPTLPEVGLKLIELMKDEDVSFNEVSDLIEREPGISTKLIKVANSSAYASGKAVSSTKEAIMRLGMQHTMNTVLLIVNSTVFEIKSDLLAGIQRDLWKHAITVAVYAKYIGKEIGYSRPDAMFALGLLHDVGKVMLLRVMQDMPEDKVSQNVEAINATMANLHTQFGPMLLQKWKFTNDFVEVAKYHHEAPNINKHSKAVLIASFANVVAHEYENGLSESSIETISQFPHFEILKLKKQSFERIQESVSTELDGLLSILSS
ncbi:MAG: HDOD domain-containing protein [Gammaproteobacteria bacterium]|nr:HDOD domain-containing protein [Gammaproteobacteria bacterium]MDH5693132.1 HDOD domain-containing protein [Gammaproteobacteria bacterium]